MTGPIPGWLPDPPPDIKALAVEMQQLTIALSEAGFTADQVFEHVKHQLAFGLFSLRAQAKGES